MDPVEAVSGASILEPIAGTAFALNIIYIGLERFRYREKIRADARQKAENLATDGPRFPAALKDLEVYKQLKSLCGLPNNNSTEIAKPDKVSRMPPEVWGVAYDLLFRKHADRVISYIAASVCAFVLASGVAHGLGIWVGTMSLFGPFGSQIWFYTVLIAGLSPVLLAVAGGWVVRKAHKHSSKCVTQMEVHLKVEVSEVVLRPSSPLPNQGQGVPRPHNPAVPPWAEQARRTALRHAEEQARQRDMPRPRPPSSRD